MAQNKIKVGINMCSKFVNKKVTGDKSFEFYFVLFFIK